MIRAILAILAFLACLNAAQAQSARSAIAKTPEQREAIANIKRQLGRGHALVIGISEFDEPKWGDLKGVQPEITMIKQALQAHDFDIEPVPENGKLTSAELAALIDGFLLRHGGRAENRLVIYIASHGFADVTDPDAKGFLIASDSLAPGKQGFADHALSVNQLSSSLVDVQAQHVFLFFNSCFSGAMLPEFEAGRGGQANPHAKALSPETAAWTLDLLSRNARLALTAGNAKQVVPDVDNPYARAVADALAGDADADGDGLVLGTEIAMFVRGKVARATRLSGNPNKENDPVFAVLPKIIAPQSPRPDLPPGKPRVDYALQSDFVFLSPRGAAHASLDGHGEQAAITRARNAALPGGQFTECADCPVMAVLPGITPKPAFARTETTFAEWDACYRELGCKRFLPDGGHGRGDRPAGGMTWQDALEFETWANTKARAAAQTEGGAQPACRTYRIPGADEWREAAQTGLAGHVPWQAVLADTEPVCRTCGEGAVQAERVASRPANGAGLHDMAGNLWEWVREPGDTCSFAGLTRSGRCETDGLVLGGAFATSAASLGRLPEGRLPRTGNARPFSRPSVGLRLACDLN